MAKIAEVFGTRVDRQSPLSPPDGWRDKACPFTGGGCDVTGNRSNMSFLEPPRSATEAEKAEFLDRYGSYGKPNFPFSICTVTSQRRSMSEARPWIVCPKRMLDLRPARSQVSPELRVLMPTVRPGDLVRAWWEVKLTHKEEGGEGHFEYTFDFLLAPIRQVNGLTRFAGPPYAIEVMTSSTRGGGLTEHLWDVLLGKPQRALNGSVDSPYTPNYRQVFGRMLSQFYVKCETLEKWGGRAIWLIQDELLQYIEESTDFDRRKFRGAEGPGTLVIYSVEDRGSSYSLQHAETLMGPTRPPANQDGIAYMTDMIGAGYIPPVAALERMLLVKPRQKAATNCRDFVWPE